MADSHINDPSHWRERARAMRKLAEDMEDGEARKNLLKVAADYDRLAERAELRSGGSGTKT